MVKYLNYTLSRDRVIPEEPMCAGLQGEHRATALVFTPDEQLLSLLEEASKGGEVVCRIDLVTEAGEYFRGENRTLSEAGNPFYLTAPMTASGLPCVAVFRLLLKGEEVCELYKAQIKLFFEASPMPLGCLSDKKGESERLADTAEEIYRGIDQRIERATELLAIKTNRVSEMVSLTAQHLKRVTELKEQTEKVGTTFSEKEFVFLGGDAKTSADTGFIVDEILSETSENPLKNCAVAAALKEASAQAVQQALLSAHPVGSLYFSAEPTEPSTLFGGEWERVKDKFILAAGDLYEAGSIGGEAEHTLTLSEMPRHNHLSNGGTLFWNSEYGNLGATSGSSIVGAGTLNENGVSTGSSIAGSSVPHNNMPPYEAYYCWKRIA